MDRDGGYTARCWCGPGKAWFSITGLEQGCAGTGSLNCFCGGDMCVCHNHGEVECDGCEDCDLGEDLG